MTDNRTTERVDHPPRVREAIDELMREKDATDNRTTELLCKMLEKRGVSCQTHYLHASWRVGSKLYDAVDNLDGTLTVDNLTPEQAIAATLGALPDRHPYEQRITGDGSDWGEIKKPTDAVREFAERYEKRIAELEAELENARAERTCRCTTDDNAWCFACSECGKSFPRSRLHYAYNHGEINFCPNCGSRVVG